MKRLFSYLLITLGVVGSVCARVEATNAEGYEDLTGYGARTNGRKNRFYIGRSTGWIPCYLEILQKNSTGGSQLFVTGRTFRLLQ